MSVLRRILFFSDEDDGNSGGSVTIVGKIVSFIAKDVTPIEELKVAIEPVQSGNGDPSPTNIRPITGRTECNFYHDIACVFPPETEITQGTVASTGKANDSVYRICSDYLEVKPSTSYTATSNMNYIGVRFYSSEDYTTCISTVSINLTQEQITFTTPAGANYARFIFSTSSGNTTQCHPSDLEWCRVISDVGETYSFTFPTEAGTVYGGTLDVVNGTLTVTDAEIASYNGETLPSTWISDRDVYAVGTTPTIGAQVVYKLATPTEIQLTPQEITTLAGENSIWADTGDITVKL